FRRFVFTGHAQQQTLVGIERLVDVESGMHEGIAAKGRSQGKKGCIGRALEYQVDGSADRCADTIACAAAIEQRGGALEYLYPLDMDQGIRVGAIVVDGQAIELNLAV